MKLNVPTTHEGARAAEMSPLQALRRSVMSCLLWEDTFYESGEEIADRIVRLVGEVAKDDPEAVGLIAVEARRFMNLRHVPLLITSALAKHARGSIISETVYQVVRRADELTELLVVHAKLNGVSPNQMKKVIPAGMKRGLSRAFGRFNEYHFGKYYSAEAEKGKPVKLRDALFMCHAKPKDDVQAALYKRIVDRQLETPDTWEVKLSGGADKKETFERLISEGKLGYLALLRNLRNMQQAGCDQSLVKLAILARQGGAERVLPFRYVAAARAAPMFEKELDQALVAAITDLPVFYGKTAVLVDVSGSMDMRLSSKSDMNRIDAAAALASIINGDVRVFSFSDRLVEVPPRKGMAGVDAIKNSQYHNGTMLGSALAELYQKDRWDRIIVVTDEQSHDAIPQPGSKMYVINVGSYRNGVGYGKNIIHVDGFSESVLRYIAEVEKEDAYN